MAGMTVLVLCLLGVFITANAVMHTVGGSDGWAGGVDYDAWASGKAFVVGDVLLFKYGYPLHTVTEVSESDYNDCSDANVIKTYTDQNTKIVLTKPGARYFICATPGHCFGGMKLAVTVSAAGNSTAHPPKTSALSAPSPAPTVAEGPYEDPSARTSSSSSSSSYTAKLPTAAATSGAAMGGGSIEQKAVLLVVVSLLGFGLMS